MKPLLLIDIDGPLNPYAALAHHGVPDGYAKHLMRPTGWNYGPPLPVLLNPEHGKALRALAGRYELVWATTWKDEANTWVGPHLGLPPLPYIDWPSMHDSGPDGTYWKTRYVVEYAAGRPFAWVDDEIAEQDRAWVLGQGVTETLLRWIDPGIGLLPSDFAALAAWADGGPRDGR
ncbi:hypothetical protein OG978_08460 [Streptomyces sp. NBC_01591]|uniref:hypothetical protein n=1 Tax=Streptomyces sp. NBC_01591 TaxID=2975888 RepID=UPI002DD8A8FF|nr:hypothetical protein [Streptomyces sp. NBC_01591]WSD67415.1 hypothetical protein OG978_08460 [Streptomyces sp. NBC_01591]